MYESLQPPTRDHGNEQQRVLKIKHLRGSCSQHSFKSINSNNKSIGSQGSVLSINRYVDG